MTSPLEGRIRVIAREEAAAAPHHLAEQLADLHEHLHLAITAVKRLEDRITTLEEAAGITTEPAPRRGRRKTVEQ